MSIHIYDSVTNSIIEQLEKGAIPWIKPWKADSSADKNFLTQKPYQGVNRLILGMASMINSYQSPAWASYKQWESKGYHVKKGMKGTQICYYEPKQSIKTDDQGEQSIESYAILKTYTVFNAEQTDIEIIPTEKPDLSGFNPMPECETFLLNSGAIITHGGDSAFYAREADKINLPNKSAFNSEANYYATAFHELIHWTGAPHRLDRTKGKRFGDKNYAFEELIAEMGAAFLCFDHKIEGDLRHAGYIESWLKALRDDNKAIFKAAAFAQKAADYANSLNKTLDKAA